MKRNVAVVALSALIVSSAPSITFAKANEKARKEKPAHDAEAKKDAIPMDTLKKMVDNNLVAKKELVIIDANSAETYAGGHIPGAIHYNEKTLLSQMPAKKDTLIVAYCGGPLCTAWKAPAEQLKAAGYTNVQHLHEGIKGWSEHHKTVKS